MHEQGSISSRAGWGPGCTHEYDKEVHQPIKVADFQLGGHMLRHPAIQLVELQSRIIPRDSCVEEVPAGEGRGRRQYSEEVPTINKGDTQTCTHVRSYARSLACTYTQTHTHAHTCKFTVTQACTPPAHTHMQHHRADGSLDTTETLQRHYRDTAEKLQRHYRDAQRMVGPTLWAQRCEAHQATGPMGH